MTQFPVDVLGREIGDIALVATKVAAQSVEGAAFGVRVTVDDGEVFVEPDGPLVAVPDGRPFALRDDGPRQPAHIEVVVVQVPEVEVLYELASDDGLRGVVLGALSNWPWMIGERRKPGQRKPTCQLREFAVVNLSPGFLEPNGIKMSSEANSVTDVPLGRTEEHADRLATFSGGSERLLASTQRFPARKSPKPPAAPRSFNSRELRIV